MDSNDSRLVVRLPEWLRQRLKSMADSESRSEAAMVRALLFKAVNARSTILDGAAGRREAFDRLADKIGHDQAAHLWQEVVLDLLEEAERRGAEKAIREIAAWAGPTDD